VLRKLDDLTVDPNDPWKWDRLDRRDKAALLSDLVSTLTQPFVLSVNGPWGAGKTTFLRMWKSDLERRGHLCFYFNAWENDFVEDPFIAIVGEIESELSKRQADVSKVPNATRLWQNVKKVGGGVLRTTGPLALRVATQGLLTMDAVESALSALGGAQGEIAEHGERLAKGRIDAYRVERLALGAFRRTLGEFAKSFQEGDGPLRGPLIIFIDELDRCRPAFAVQLLERVKHLFNVPGVLFVLAIHRDQLAHSVRGVYGAGIDARGYLSRFIDLEFWLPEPSPEEYTKVLFERFEIEEALQRRSQGQIEADNLAASFAGMARVFGFSLRTQEQTVSTLNVILRTMAPKWRLPTHLLSVLIALRFGDPQLYDDFKNGRTGAQRVLERIAEMPGGKAFLDGRGGVPTETYLYLSTGLDREFESWKANLHNQANDPPSPMQKRAMAVQGLLQQLDFDSPRDWIRKYIFDRIELTRRFAE
jgi:hypothetical protein